MRKSNPLANLNPKDTGPGKGTIYNCSVSSNGGFGITCIPYFYNPAPNPPVDAVIINLDGTAVDTNTSAGIMFNSAAGASSINAINGSSIDGNGWAGVRIGQTGSEFTTSSLQINLTDSSISGNTGEGITTAGGGSDFDIVLNNSTVSNNTADAIAFRQGTGAEADLDVTLQNGSTIDCAGAALTGVYCATDAPTLDLTVNDSAISNLNRVIHPTVAFTGVETVTGTNTTFNGVANNAIHGDANSLFDTVVNLTNLTADFTLLSLAYGDRLIAHNAGDLDMTINGGTISNFEKMVINVVGNAAVINSAVIDLDGVSFTGAPVDDVNMNVRLEPSAGSVMTFDATNCQFVNFAGAAIRYGGTIANAVATLTDCTISGSGGNAGRFGAIEWFPAVSTTLNLDNTAITGNPKNAIWAQAGGGPVYDLNTSNNTNLSGNTGSGVYAFLPGGSMDIDASDTTFGGNTGRAIECQGAVGGLDITATNCTFDSNTQGIQCGGAAAAPTTLNLTGCSVSGNVNQGIESPAISPSFALTAVNCTMDNNGLAAVNSGNTLTVDWTGGQALNNGGPGLRLGAVGDADITLTDVTLSGNAAGAWPWGNINLWTPVNTTITLNNSSLDNAVAGGGIEYSAVTNATLIMSNGSSISGNAGRGVQGDPVSGKFVVTATDSTINGNAADGIGANNDDTTYSFTGCSISNNAGSAVACGGVTSGVVQTLSFDDCHLDGNNYGINLWSGDVNYDVTITSSTVNNNTTHGLHAAGGGAVPNTYTLTDVTFDGNTGLGVNLFHLATQDVTWVGGSASGNGSHGIDCVTADIDITDVVFANNTELGLNMDGGGSWSLTDCEVYGNGLHANIFMGGTCLLTMNNTIVRDPVANVNVWSWGGTDHQLNLTDCTITGGGYGVLFDTPGTSTLNNCTFETFAIQATRYNPGTDVTYNGTTFQNIAVNLGNIADGATVLFDGCNITNCPLGFDVAGTDATFDGCTFTNGRAANSLVGGDPMIVNCTFQNGGSAVEMYGGHATIDSSIFLEALPLAFGAGVSTATLTNSTVERLTTYGPTLWVGGTATGYATVENVDLLTTGAAALHMTTGTLKADFNHCTFVKRPGAKNPNLFLLDNAYPETSLTFDQCDFANPANDTGPQGLSGMWIRSVAFSGQPVDFPGSVTVIDSILNNCALYNDSPGVATQNFNLVDNGGFVSATPLTDPWAGGTDSITGSANYTTTTWGAYGYLTLGGGSAAASLNSGNGPETYAGAKGGFNPVQHWAVFE